MVKELKIIGKKGLSDVLANVMMIMLAIVAVGIIGASVKQIVSSPSFSPQFSCLDMQASRHIYVDSACYNATSGEITSAVKRTLSDRFDIKELRFVIDFEGKDSASWKCGAGCTNCNVLQLGNRRIYYFDVKDLGKPTTINLLADGCDAGKEEIKAC